MTSNATATTDPTATDATGWPDVWEAAHAEISKRDWVLRAYKADLQAIQDALLDDERVLAIRPLYDSRDEPWKGTGAIVVTPRRLLVVPTGPLQATKGRLFIRPAGPPTAETVLFSDIASASLRRTVLSGMKLTITTRDGRRYESSTGAKRAGPERFLTTLQEQIARAGGAGRQQEVITP